MPNVHTRKHSRNFLLYMQLPTFIKKILFWRGLKMSNSIKKYGRPIYISAEIIFLCCEKWDREGEWKVNSNFMPLAPFSFLSSSNRHYNFVHLLSYQHDYIFPFWSWCLYLKNLARTEGLKHHKAQELKNSKGDKN